METTTTGGIMSLLPTILMFAVLIYFMIIRPQKKKQQNAKNLLASLKVGDKIQTIGGFIGEILEMSTDEFIISSEESKLRIKKNAVAIRIDSVEEIEDAEIVYEEDTEVISKEDKNDEDFKIEDFEI